ncbi:TM2 domain-containing protein CG10795 [Trichonephila clavata]|uniref:TM2 domain-containing protein CG10795 n=1 Tax=Trichonephila clavata TaxID=2740835 RepID=A0A8X6GG21_TRICU|nr:TM2 domain-containing protein CG10795 [Trichonephila clavata]
MFIHKTIGLYTYEPSYETNCSNLLMGQYLCLPPDIDPKTQQPRSCQKNNVAKVLCKTIHGIICKHGTGLNETMFEKDIDCEYTNGYSYETALLLSLFLGMFGIDRFYLGYPAIGLAKLCTLGFMFLGQLIDIILIALQVVGPADGSHYVISYFGPKLTILRKNNDTFIMPQDDW